ncbi:MAG: UDP-N-acetylmuramate--L-alanine ligase [Culturomica sp.]|jgi:UDP-N-acetylmuramate--alanine ligase|nr:UDP-N-acetylmuramate--L-alanine ligase [Culturomica sp.]
MDSMLKEPKNVYFVGIGGIGMSALARWFRLRGFRVGGYDRTPSPLTEKMRTEEQIEINYRDDAEAIPAAYRSPEDTLLIYTPAVPKESRQLGFFLRNGFVPHKRSQVLGMLSRSGKALCIAGTHGKTTTTTLLAYLLKKSSVGCNAFLGGISVNFGTNLLTDPSSDYMVVEADEYDRSFLQLDPWIAGITAMDADHLDIYGDRESMVEAFGEFADRTAEKGLLFLKKGLRLTGRKADGYYAVDEPGDICSDHLRVEGIRYRFDYHGRGREIPDLLLGIPGRINVENATLAIAVALEAGVTPDEIRAALPGFRGVERRFSILAEGRVTYMDDYAHHPREIEAVLSSAREMWPDKKLTVAFQPHLYTRTRDLSAGFAAALDLADEVLLLEIYPAREEPLPGVDSGLIRKQLKKPGRILSKEALLKYAEEVREGVFMTMGAGDIDRLVPALTRLFAKR